MNGDYSLGYLRFEVSDPAAWGRLLTDVIGLGHGGKVGGSAGYRLDNMAARVQIIEGPLDDVAGVGLVAQSQAAFDAAIARLSQEGVAIEAGDSQEAAERRVRNFVKFRDPDGAPLELALGQTLADDDFVSPLVISGFYTENFGIGHIVMTSQDLDASFKFYEKIFGAVVSDVASQPMMGLEPIVGFMRLNARHHSIAFVSKAPLPKRTAHFQFEARDKLDVGRAFDRARISGVPIVQELGAHPDGAFSFYAATPSGFLWEIGAETYELDDSWSPRQLRQFSLWGHRAPGAPGASVEAAS